ncbi:MAG: DNA internalization-related competence protein ComEC/Rec2 [Candidatus Sumerlaeia bacterium]|nr:DNA internalization-related competence protein ComEC/Rec2 [Candidatus Sumerlaeia bacterium]
MKAVHVSLARPGMVGLLALVAGHLMSKTLGVPEVVWLALIALSTALMLLFRVRSPIFPMVFCVLVAAVGGWQTSRLIARDGVAAGIVTYLADGGTPLGEIRGTLARMPARSATHWTFTLAAGSQLDTRGMTATIPAPVIVRVAGDATHDRELRPLIPGDEIRAVGEVLELPRGGIGSEQWGWYSDRGAVLLLRARDIQSMAKDHSVLSPGRLARFSWNLGNRAEAWMFFALPNQQAGLLSAMTLGRTGNLTADQRVSFRRAGLMHIFAVSGIHTALVGGLFLGAMRLMGVPVWWRLILLSLFLIMFATLVGWKASVLRAALLLFLFDFREVLRRPLDPLGALGAAGMGLLLLWPRSLWQVDFQMTFLCMVAIFLSAPWLNELRKSLGKRVGWGWRGEIVIRSTQILAISAVIQLLLSPVLAGRFGEVSLVAPIANLFLLSLAAICIKATFLLFLLGLAFPWGATAAMKVLVAPLELLAWGADVLAGLPFAALSTPPWPLFLVFLFYGTVWFSEWNRHHHFSQPRRSAWAFMPGGLVLLLVFIWIPLWGQLPGSMRIWVLDVGQGDAILVRSPDGRFALIDGGPAGTSWLLPDMLRSRGVKELDWVIATHADADHIAGLPSVLREIPTHKLLVNGGLAGTRIFESLGDVVAQLDQPVATIRRGARIPLGNSLVFDVLHPTGPFIEGDLSRNDASIVVQTTFGGTTILLTGDAESAAERDMVDEYGEALRSDIALAAHHGSRGSSTMLFLEHVQPSLALISCGRNNTYGHPHQEVLDRLDAVGAEVRRTDLDGTIRVDIHRRGGWTVSATRW